MLKQVIVGALFAIAATAHADGIVGANRTTNLNSACNQYNYNAAACNSAWGCEFYYPTNQCVQEGQTFPQPNPFPNPNPNPWPNPNQGQCSQYNYNPTACQQVPGCRYDFTNNLCSGQTNPWPNPNPNPWPNPNPNPNPWPNPNQGQCSQYNYNPTACQQVPGCRYDFTNNLCSGQTNPWPNPNPNPNPWPQPSYAFCAGGPANPAFVLSSEQEARQCAAQIARGGRDCLQYARYGSCQTIGVGPGYSVLPGRWCQCVTSGSNGGPISWIGIPYRL